MDQALASKLRTKLRENSLRTFRLAAVHAPPVILPPKTLPPVPAFSTAAAAAKWGQATDEPPEIFRAASDVASSARFGAAVVARAQYREIVARECRPDFTWARTDGPRACRSRNYGENI